MRRLLLFAALSLTSALFSGCRDNTLTPKKSTGYEISTSLFLTVENAAGEDLIDPSNPQGFKYIRLYYDEDGTKKLYSDSQLDAVYGYNIVKHPDNPHYKLQVYLGVGQAFPAGLSQSVTYVQLAPGTELLPFTFEMSVVPFNQSVKKVWLKDKLIWVFEDGPREYKLTLP